jgi:hypothetical protein
MSDPFYFRHRLDRAVVATAVATVCLIAGLVLLLAGCMAQPPDPLAEMFAAPPGEACVRNGVLVRGRAQCRS